MWVEREKEAFDGNEGNCAIFYRFFSRQFFMTLLLWHRNSPFFRFELRGLLSLWNTMLAMFSIMGAFRTAPELIHVLRNYGLFHSVCVPRWVLTLKRVNWGSLLLSSMNNWNVDSINYQKVHLKMKADLSLRSTDLLLFWSKINSDCYHVLLFRNWNFKKFLWCENEIPLSFDLKIAEFLNSSVGFFQIFESKKLETSSGLEVDEFVV